VKEKVNPPNDDELSREEEIVKTPDADDLIKEIDEDIEVIGSSNQT